MGCKRRRPWVDRGDEEGYFQFFNLWFLDLRKRKKMEEIGERFCSRFKIPFEC
jgi:hypothetical protein